MSTRAENRPIDPQMQMMAIAREMKEIPELPSEAPKDVSTLTHVEFVDEGGVHTYIEGHEYPYKGYPYVEFVEKIDTLKKIWRGVLSSLYHSLKKRNALELSSAILVPWLFGAMVDAALYASHRVIVRFRFKADKYSKAVRELHRAFGDEEIVRDIVCMILENDNAYRYRFQDVIVELDKEALQKNPGKELVRLLDIMQSRETHTDVSDTWTLLKTFLPALLSMSKSKKELIVNVLTELNLEKVALDDGDKWYASPRKDYICNFRTNPTESDKDIIARAMRRVEREEERAKVREESTKAHEALFDRQLRELGVTDEEHALVVKLDEELSASINREASQKYEIGRNNIRRQVFGDERMALMERQLQEVQEMDKVYNDKLQAIT